jgi:hypothetical protein
MSIRPMTRLTNALRVEVLAGCALRSFSSSTNTHYKQISRLLTGQMTINRTEMTSFLTFEIGPKSRVQKSKASGTPHASESMDT